MNSAGVKRISPDNNLVYYTPCNIYSTVKWGDNCKVGAFTEIGNNVEIGSNVTIGAFCFIPEGVKIEDDCWIGPRVTFTNDKYPPSSKSSWQTTIVKRGARLGAAVTVLCGIEIGEDALIGAGSVITKDVPEGAIWCGVPAGDIHLKDNIIVARRRTKFQRGKAIQGRVGQK